MKKIGIVGGSGFIGSYITKKFLEEGYHVKVSATDIFNEEKYKHLWELENSDRLQIQQLDVANEEELQEFVSDCSIIIHGGTPFLLDFKDPQSELFDPTIKGTENILEIINKTSSVTKVVFIASVAAYNTNFPMPAGEKSPNDIFNENDTPYINEDSHPYAQAKFLANQTVIKFINENPSIHFEITSVSPVAVMGKSLSKREDSTSTGLQFLFKNKMAPNPFIQMIYDSDAEFAVVDVKDVAHGVYKAATISNLHGKNYLLSSESYPVSDITLMLNKQEPKNQAKIIYQNQLAKNDLGIQFQPVIKTLEEFSS